MERTHPYSVLPEPPILLNSHNEKAYYFLLRVDDTRLSPLLASQAAFKAACDLEGIKGIGEACLVYVQGETYAASLGSPSGETHDHTLIVVFSNSGTTDVIPIVQAMLLVALGKVPRLDWRVIPEPASDGAYQYALQAPLEAVAAAVAATRQYAPMLAFDKKPKRFIVKGQLPPNCTNPAEVGIAMRRALVAFHARTAVR